MSVFTLENLDLRLGPLLFGSAGLPVVLSPALSLSFFLSLFLSGNAEY